MYQIADLLQKNFSIIITFQIARILVVIRAREQWIRKVENALWSEFVAVMSALVTSSENSA